MKQRNARGFSATLSNEYRKSVRAKVHRVVTDPGSFGNKLDTEIQRAKGKIGYLGKFHKVQARNLKSQIGAFERSRSKPKLRCRKAGAKTYGQHRSKVPVDHPQPVQKPYKLGL